MLLTFKLRHKLYNILSQVWVLIQHTYEEITTYFEKLNIEITSREV